MRMQFTRGVQRFGALMVVVRAARRALIDYRKESRKKALRHARRRSIDSYLAAHQIRKLQIGAGDNPLEGWLNSDLDPSSTRIIFLDVLEEFPFEDQVFDYVFSEHLIEHLMYQDGLFMLREIYRIIRPGGKLRIATPNIEAIIGLYSPERTELQKQYLAWSAKEVMGLYSPEKTELQKYFPEWDIDYDHINRHFPDARQDSVCFVVNSFFRSWGHQFLYDASTLQAAMEGAGFVEATRCSPGESSDENLRGTDSHADIIGNEMNQFETMVLEATRPFVVQK